MCWRTLCSNSIYNIPFGIFVFVITHENKQVLIYFVCYCFAFCQVIILLFRFFKTKTIIINSFFCEIMQERRVRNAEKKLSKMSRVMVGGVCLSQTNFFCSSAPEHQPKLKCKITKLQKPRINYVAINVMACMQWVIFLAAKQSTHESSQGDN